MHQIGVVGSEGTNCENPVLYKNANGLKIIWEGLSKWHTGYSQNTNIHKYDQEDKMKGVA